jgi:uncharacterized membrane protein YfcA
VSAPLEIAPGTLAILAATSFGAGAIDAIAGGGGLLTVPALLAAGLPPGFALGTNKGQAVFGSGAALLRYARAGQVDRARARLSFPAGFLGALLGAALVLAIDPTLLRPLVLVLLVAAAVLVTFRRPDETRATPRAGSAGPLAVLAIAALLGAYDGFFGPGTGTFLIIAFVELVGLSMARATAEAKVVNFASNLASLAVFASRGATIWTIALPMGACQLLGGLLGAELAILGGARLIRAAVLLVIAGLLLKLGLDLTG